MRKRRVGVTAGSGQIAGNRATGSLQIESEIAAPLELRTPMSTAAKAANRVRMEAWRQWRWSQWTEGQSEKSSLEKRERDLPPRSGARNARMRRCLILRQGASPLRPPAPFPSASMFQNGGNLSRVRKPRGNGAPLTDCHRSEDSAEMRERGPLARAGGIPRKPGGAARSARMRRCLMLRQGASPLRPQHFPLDREWPSHGSPER